MANSVSWLASRIKQDENNRLVSDTQITAWNGKADAAHTHTKSQITDFPTSIKNPTSLSIQLNGGTATVYDGSTAKSINITPAGIGAAASSHTHDYIPLSGTEALSGSISIANGKPVWLGADANPFQAVFSHEFKVYTTGQNKSLKMALNGLGIVIYSGDSFGTLSAQSLTGTRGWSLPDKSGTLAITDDIPTSLPASDVYDWAKAATKPSYTWTEIGSKPDTFTPSAHTHTIANVTGLQTALDGKAASSHTHGDADITSIAASKITGTISIDHLPQGALDRLVRVDDDAARFKLTTKNVQLGDTVKVKSSGLMYYVVDESKLGEEAGYEPYTAGSATSVPWSGVTGKPSTFTPSAHTHTIANVTGLQGALDGKAASSHTHTKSQITDFPSSIKNPTSVVIKLNGGTTEGTNMFTYDGSAAKSISITPAGIGAAASSHTHTIANVTGLQGALDGKAASSHTHTKDQVGLGNVDNTADSVKNVAMATKLQTYKNDSTTETYGTQYPLFAQWDSTGKIINMVCTGYTVRVQSAATADSANAVTWGNVSGKPSTYTPSSHTHTKSQITDFPASLKNPTSLSIQLNGGTATAYDGSSAKSINITPASIGAAASSHTHTIANVTGLQTALDGKAASSHTHTIANVTGLQGALDGKAASSHTHAIANVTGLQTALDSKVSNAPTLVTNWNNATAAGYYYAAKGATNTPEATLGYFGQVCKSTTSIIQTIFPEGASGDIKQYMRRGTISGSAVTWETDWACITYALS